MKPVFGAIAAGVLAIFWVIACSFLATVIK